MTDNLPIPDLRCRLCGGYIVIANGSEIDCGHCRISWDSEGQNARWWDA